MTTSAGDPAGVREQLADALARITSLETSLTELQQVITDTVDTLTTNGTTAPVGGAAPKAETALDLGRLDAWVTDWLLPTFPRRLGGPGGRWCAQWWRHPEAVIRLEALRTAFVELSRAGGTGVGGWLREHLDVQLAVLLSDAGPFAACSAKDGRHDPEDPLPVDPIPDQLRGGRLALVQDGPAAPVAGEA